MGLILRYNLYHIAPILIQTMYVYVGINYFFTYSLFNCLSTIVGPIIQSPWVFACIISYDSSDTMV